MDLGPGVNMVKKMENDTTKVSQSKDNLQSSLKQQSIFEKMKSKQHGQYLRPTFAFQSNQEGDSNLVSVRN